MKFTFFKLAKNEILADPPQGSTTHCRAFVLEDNSRILEYVRMIGDTESCTTCTENEVNQSHGLRLTVMGNLNEDGTVAVTRVMSAETGCGDIPVAVPPSCPSTTPGNIFSLEDFNLYFDGDVLKLS